MTLLPAIEAYVELKRSLCAVFTTDARVLHSFGHRLGDVPLETISAESCSSFCRGEGPPTAFWERKHTTLHGFCRYLVSRGYLPASPLPGPGPRIRSSFQPYIYSRDEVQRLLDATDILDPCESGWKPRTYRTLVLLLYGTGLRAGEALRLRCCDVDLDDHVLAIWDTKFFKSRLVPIGAEFGRRLTKYGQERGQLPMPAGIRSAFFVTETGKAISLGKLETVFVQLREHADIRRPLTDRWQPRLHDLRHAFAVHRLIAWYREGVDVQTRLPFLATYLGHVNLSGTRTYLTMTPDLLTEASRRFEKYADLAKEGLDG